MINKILKIVIKMFIILIFFQVINTPVVQASEYIGNILNIGSDFVKQGKEATKQDNPTDGDKMSETTDIIYNTLLAIGIALSVVIGAILGIQLMWGSIEQQVKAKEMLMPYVAGCLVVFGAFAIWKICVVIFSQL